MHFFLKMQAMNTATAAYFEAYGDSAACSSLGAMTQV